MNIHALTRWGLALATGLTLGQAAQARTDVGVQVSVHQPGFYGRVEIGQQAPRVIYAQPVVVQQSPVAVVQKPIYLHVPEEHHRHWNRYCNRWRACGQPVYFVPAPARHGYRAGYAEGYQQAREDHRERRRERHEHRGHGRGHGHDHH